MICVIIAAVLGLAGCIILIYNSGSNVINLINGVRVSEILSWQQALNPLNIAAFVCICGALLMLLLAARLEGRHPVREFLDRYRPKESIHVCRELQDWENDIYFMCHELGIRALRAEMTEDGTAQSRALHFEYPEVIFARSLMQVLQGYFDEESYRQVVLFILGHELAHIQSGDTYYRYNRRMLAAFFLPVTAVLAASWFVNLGSLQEFPASRALGTRLLVSFCILALFIIFIVSPAHEDIRYWGQVNELRADRIGLQVSGVSADLFKELFECLEKNEKNNECSVRFHNTRRSSGTGRLRKILRKKWEEKFHDRMEDDPHPSWEVRVREIEKYGSRKWGIRDELMYMCRFSWNIRFRKEWGL